MVTISDLVRISKNYKNRNNVLDEEFDMLVENGVKNLAKQDEVKRTIEKNMFGSHSKGKEMSITQDEPNIISFKSTQNYGVPQGSIDQEQEANNDIGFVSSHYGIDLGVTGVVSTGTVYPWTPEDYSKLTYRTDNTDNCYIIRSNINPKVTWNMRIHPLETYKYNEVGIINDINDYIYEIYEGQHYKTDKNIECFDAWISLGSAFTTFRDTAIKYLWRVGKKGSIKTEFRKDLIKAIHYIILMIYSLDNETKGNEK